MTHTNIDTPGSSEIALERFTPRYDITEEEARLLCIDFLNNPNIDVPDTPFGGYVIDGNDRYSNLGRYVESKVFNETFGNGPKLMSGEYSEYDQASEFYVVVDHEANLPIGIMRVIKNSEAGLKSLNDLIKLNLGFSEEDLCREYNIVPDRTADIGTLAVLPEYRGSRGKAGYLPSLIAQRMLWPQVIANPDLDSIITIIDKKAERNLTTLKFPFIPVFGGKYFSYLDSPESRILIAQTSDFLPQLTETVQRLRSESNQEKGDGQKELIASTIESLISPGFIDPFLTKPVRERAKN